LGAYTTDKRAKTQATNDFITLTMTPIAAFFSAAIEQSVGWTVINVETMIPVLSVFSSVILFKFI
jgi:hypothetical protein